MRGVVIHRVPGMSARVDCFPHPAADPASSKVYVVWCDFDGVQGVVKAAVSVDGFQWTQLGTVAQVSGRNAFFPQASVAPSGLVALIFLALTQPPANDHSKRACRSTMLIMRSSRRAPPPSPTLSW